MDGVGEWATASYGAGEGNKIELSGQLRFPHSLGMLYSAITYFTGFTVNSDEYKVMGLAPYGEPVYRDLFLSELMDLREDGSFRLNMDYFDYCAGLTMTSDKLADLLGALPRVPDSEIRRIDMDLARSVQEVTEEIILKIARFVRKETGENRLVMSGGVALNSVANGKLQREGIFDEIWVQPAAGDAGSALGAALFGWHHHLGKGRRVDRQEDHMKGALLGPAYAEGDVEEILGKAGAVYERLEETELLEKVVKVLDRGDVVGWFQGRMEFGPRALGSRSILADARRIDMRETLNKKIKFREPFRPFAPSVLREKATEYFEISGDSPYMLIVCPVTENYLLSLNEEESSMHGLGKLKVVRSDIPAVTHVDNTARVQTVGGQWNPLFLRLLETFGESTGTPLLVNTSFNVLGEPIVCTPADALLCFMRSGMDYLAIGPFFLEKTRQTPSMERSLSTLRGPHPSASHAKRQLRLFGLSVGGALVLWSVVAWWRFEWALWWIPMAAGGFFAAVVLIRPVILTGIHAVWSSVTTRLGRGLSYAALALAYYGVLLPTALLSKTLNRRVFTKGPDQELGTYWENFPDSSLQSYEKQF